MAEQIENGSRATRTKWLIAIVPAVLTGVFVLTPFLWEKFATPKALLDYKYQASGDIVEGSKHVSMLIINVKNSGSQRLSNIDVFINPDAQKIIQVSVVPRLLKFSRHEEFDGNRINIDVLLPAEEANITVLSEGATLAKYDVKVRSAETSGQLKKEGDKPDVRYLIAFAIACAVLMYIVQWSTNYYFRKKLEEERNAHRMRIADVEVMWFKPNILIHIAALCGFPEIIRIIWDAEGSMEFFGAADIIFGEANATDSGSIRMRAANALVSILVVPKLSAHTEKSIMDMLKHLEHEIPIDEIKNIVADAKAGIGGSVDYWVVRESINNVNVRLEKARESIQRKVNRVDK